MKATISLSSSRRWLVLALIAQLALLGALVWAGLTLEASLFHRHGLTSAVGPTSGPSPSAHEGGEGLLLASAGNQETVAAGARCAPGATVRRYDLVAVNVQITLNRYLDYDPQGRMYVLEGKLERVRQEEAQNKAARADQAEPAVSVGLQGDAVQPLVLRVNQGECLQVSLRNGLERGEPASFHLHGSSLYLPATGAPALATLPEATVRPGETVTYTWWVAQDEPEGTHYVHSHGDTRSQTNHGLFGAVIVEPKGSEWLDPITGNKLQSGWTAIIRDPSGSDFREFAIIYHEIGNERYRHLDKRGKLVVQVDPLTGAYRPGDRAINYRSEPFMNRLMLQQQAQGHFDESLAYSSYTFGDPATPLARSYLGDPVKERVVHGGSEVFHAHHVHGGSTRWRRQPAVESNRFDSGLDKHPPLTPQATERTDAQSLGPSESYDVEHECGSGGCQQGAGDYMIHCHVAHHYFAGMWMIWRVYNTLQNGSASQDGLPTLKELPDRAGRLEPAVTSAGLIGKTVAWSGQRLAITASNLSEWVERQLPPQGVPKGYDASVWDWQRNGDVYLAEPESAQTWPGYASTTPGERPPIYFDPVSGKPAYPLMRPHLGQRPPFAPNHGPAPFLDPSATGAELPPPGTSGPSSLCPAGTNTKTFTIHAITLPVGLNERLGLSDPVGQLYVLKEEEDRVRAENRHRVPLAIRTNAGEDCLDVLFKSELKDSRENAFLSKTGLHIHFVQFDVQGSDGVTTGFNFEQSVRPFTVAGEALSAPARAGETGVRLANSERFSPGALVGVGMDEAETFEVARIWALSEGGVTFDAPLRFDHTAGEIVSSEFVHYRWYPDVQFGTAYFHDHVAALSSWQHGLYGALIAEPPGSRYRDPHSGEELASGPIADIHTDAAVSTDIKGGFRELVLFIQDDNPLTRVGDASGSSFNLRVEPPDKRSLDPAERFASAPGDPETPVLEAYLGDPLVIRGLVAATNDMHTLHLEGHSFRIEPYSAASPLVSAAHLGISERLDLSVASAGGAARQPGDYLLRNGRASKLREGSWGLLRVYAANDGASLRKLPGHETPPEPPAALCPEDAPQKDFRLVALDLPLAMLGGGMGKVFALEADRSALLAGERPAEPLVLHVNLGDCLRLDLRNDTTGGPVSLYTDRLAADPAGRGLAVGRSSAQLVPPGETRSYRYYVAPELGAGATLLLGGADPLTQPRLGLYGAVILGAAGTRYTDPVSGADRSLGAGWRVDAHPVAAPSYRDVTLFIQDDDEIIGTALMPYTESVRGVLGLNYRLEPLAARLAVTADPATVFRSDLHGDPATPLLEAYEDDAVRLHLLAPYSEQAHVFSLEGHRWPLTPGLVRSNLLDSVQLGALEAVTLEVRAGAPGDYLYGDHREPYREAGLWGLFRVYAPGEPGANLLPLSP